MNSFFPELVAWIGGGFVLAFLAAISILLYALDGLNGIALGVLTIGGILGIASAGAHFLA
tara:strand:- start:1278 stop:1457 length:180 start_codon:yes stop_codon:yes gene_type:complete